MQPFTAVYLDNKVIVPTESEADSLLQNGFGVKENVLVLESFEVLYNIERGKINVIDEMNEKLSFQKLLNIFSYNDKETWIKFIVYKDLRTKGFFVRKSRKEKEYFDVFERGTYHKEPPKYKIHIISEGSPEQLSNLVSSLIANSTLGFEMKIAVVDRRGDIIYYSLNEKEFN